MRGTDTARRMAGPLLDIARRNGRQIAWTPDFMGLGNLVTLGRWAYDGHMAGEQRWVLLPEKRAPLLERLFPELAQKYFLAPSEIRFTDQRVQPWTVGAESSKELDALRGYIRDVLLPSSPITKVVACDPGALVINVRRGDYYSVDQHRVEFGISIAAYLRQALDHSLGTEGTPSSILVVSDDTSWCREHIDSLLRPHAPVAYQDQGDPVRDLAAVVHARRVILSNSTFSYWGGFIGDQLVSRREVIVPWLFSRSFDGGSSHRQVSPHWTVIDLPGGWPVPAADA